MSKITVSKTQIEIDGITYKWITFDELADDMQNAIIKESHEIGKILQVEKRESNYGDIILIYVQFRNGYITRLVPTELTSGHQDMHPLMDVIDWDTDNLNKLIGMNIEYIPYIAIDGKTKSQRKTEDNKRILTFKFNSIVKDDTKVKTVFGNEDFQVTTCGICGQKVPRDSFKKHVAGHS